MTRPSLPPARGKLIEGAALAPYTWFRVGGPADVLFLPEDETDLAGFLSALDSAVPVTALGVGSNLIVRDGGLPGIVIRPMGRAWGEVMKTGELELIRENLNTLLAELRRDVAYADLQNSFGRIFVSMGLDLVPEGFGQKSVDELSKDIGQSFNRWEDGKLDLVTLQSPATAPQPDGTKVSSKTGKE